MSSNILFKNSFEYLPSTSIEEVPKERRGLYVLYRMDEGSNAMKVVYVGLTTSGFKNRLKAHLAHKDGQWTHFSVFEVQDSVEDDQLRVLEGFLLHIYRDDPDSNGLNVQKRHGSMSSIRRQSPGDWIP